MNNQRGYLIIDVGTGNVRVAVVAREGRILGIARADLKNIKDPNYTESLYFEPNELWKQIQELARLSLAQAPDIHIEGITATSQREGIVLIGKDGESLIGLPNIDHRGRAWEDMLLAKDEVYQLTGRFPTSLFSAFKLIGIEKKRPEIWEKLASFMSISDWVEYKMSGVIHYEHSQASETLLYDVAKKEWSPKLCDLFNLDFKLLANLTPSGTILGTVLASEAEAIQISPNAKVIVGGADTQLAVISTKPSLNDVVIVSGTTTPIIKLTETYVTDQLQRTWTNRHTDENSFILETNAGVTGLNYQRLKEIFYPTEDYDVIEKELAELQDFQCVASLGSLVAKEKSPLTRGGFIFNVPISHQLTRASFVWATLWDIACCINENYKTLCEVTAHEPDYIWACGGGVQSPVLRQFLANLLGKKIIINADYRQASVIGGVYICNEALGFAPLNSSILDETIPQSIVQFEERYTQWKETRNSFRKTFC
ncbi:FGGY family carbohydrate kinase [Pedobacter sp. Du54]|uniref:FGGY-family carbohydrate kinase n=1 Tax=Pedobacter anseongensis TaxID=3133439 RepID=UPI0030B77C53